MEQDPIKKVLEGRRQGGGGTTATAEPEVEGDRFFSVHAGEVVEEQYLELRFNTGIRVCLAYDQLLWFDYDPEAGIIDLEFGVMMVILEGRGLGGELFEALKRCRVSWVTEATTEMQDHKGNKTFIKEIRIVLPGAGENGEAEQA